MDVNNKKIAIVHDWLVNYGGAERVVETFLEMFPNADILTNVYDEHKMGKIFPKEKIKTTFIQKIPGSKKHYPKLLPFMPYAIEELDMNKYDLVISSSSCCAKGVITPPNVPHISYVYTPMRYAWDQYHQYKNKYSKILRPLISYFMKSIREWDYTSSQRIDKIIADSDFVSARIKKYWNINAKTIYPPVNTDFLSYNGKESESFYIAFSRLVPYKRIDLVIEACNELGKELVVIGDGTERKKLEAIAGDTVKFLGRLPDKKVKEYMQKCKALIFPAEEDFGIIPVEVQACGRPVIAYGKGGVLETVINEKTGIFFYEQTVDDIKEAIIELEKTIFSWEEISINANRFSKERFKNEIMREIEKF